VYHRCRQPGHSQGQCKTVLSRAFIREQRGDPISKLRALQMRHAPATETANAEAGTANTQTVAWGATEPANTQTV
jgi:hypothetical protein